MPDPQPAINAPQTQHAIFLVLVVNDGPENAAHARQVCGEIAALVRSVAARDPAASLSCIVAFGSDAWERLFDAMRPRELHPFRELRSGNRHAPSTPGDILLHIRADRADLCFELAAQILARFRAVVRVADEVHGFRYFDDRDLIGFVDGTENPTGPASVEATIIGAEDAAFAGGSYVIVQKYLHDLAKWNAVPVETQERIIGRTKLDDIELDPAVKPSFAHNALNVVVENGAEVPILRHNMPFGMVGHGDSGTYFIAYARSPATIEQMLTNMFIGNPPGNYDRLLDFTTPVTGSNFFAPSMSFLSSLSATAEPAAAIGAAAAEPAAAAPIRDGSLRIGGLKGVLQHE